MLAVIMPLQALKQIEYILRTSTTGAELVIGGGMSGQ